MKDHKYVSFITDEHLLSCIENLYHSYTKAKENISKKKFYNNKIDSIKLTFDAKFNYLDEESIIEQEILRQTDKSINNSIGTFHEQILGGIDGYEIGNLSGFDIKAKDNTLFAILSFDEVPVKFQEFIFEKLAKQANTFKNSTCYFVDFSENTSLSEKWIIGNNELTISHKKVFKITADYFYTLLSGQDDAIIQLNKTLPVAIKDFLKNIIN